MENEIAGSYPIIIDGITEGEIAVSREGLFWIFEAKCNMRDEIVRLSVYGDGAEGYLGVMEPYGDILQLTKKLSRTALSTFPQSITHGGQKGGSEVVAYDNTETFSEPAVVADNSSPAPLAYEYDNFDSGIVPPESDKPPPFTNIIPLYKSGDVIWQPCAVPCSLFSGIAEKKICGYIKGALLAKEDDVLFLAVPESIYSELPKNNFLHFTNEVIISGENFLICKIKNGKSFSEP